MLRPIKIWLPCALGAVALHLLVLGIWLAFRHESPPRTGQDEPVAVRFRFTGPKEESSTLADDELENRAGVVTLAHLRDSFLKRDAHMPWEGSYNTGVGFTGTFLFLTADGFYGGDWNCSGERTRWGKVTTDEDSVTLGADSSGGAPARYFVMPWHGWTYLISATEMRVYLDRALSGELQSPAEGPSFLEMEKTMLPDRDRAPDGYCALWSSLPHIAVLRVTEATGPTPRLVEFEVPESELTAEQQLTLYWDADPTGCVRAIERERQGNRIEAFLEGCDGISAGAVAVGATFTRLARLR